MTREIKFRGWHVQNQRMFSAEEMAVDQLTLLPTGSFINVHGVHTHLSTIYDREKFIPMQFTGLKDKNGKEIYEGDIVKVTYGTAKVIYNRGSFMIEWLDDREANMELLGERCIARHVFRTRDDLEVIGNIYENPELVTP